MSTGWLCKKCLGDQVVEEKPIGGDGDEVCVHCCAVVSRSDSVFMVTPIYEELTKNGKLPTLPPPSEYSHLFMCMEMQCEADREEGREAAIVSQEGLVKKFPILGNFVKLYLKDWTAAKRVYLAKVREWLNQD